MTGWPTSLIGKIVSGVLTWKIYMQCSICYSEAPFWDNIDGYDFSDCHNCGAIALDARSMAAVDDGAFPRNYDPSYWAMETSAAKERSWGAAIARVAETILYCRRPIDKFVDIGSGPGFLLDSLSTYLPDSKNIFYGVEMFPPDTHTDHPNYIVGNLSSVDHMFDAGVCIEVFEHLTPTMLGGLAYAMAKKSQPGAFYIINTALADYVRHDLRSYIDPLGRGHIVAWSLKAIAAIFEPFGFTVVPLNGKSWAFGLEYLSDCDIKPEDRIWTAPCKNVGILQDQKMGAVSYVLGIDTARAYRV